MLEPRPLNRREALVVMASGATLSSLVLASCEAIPASSAAALIPVDLDEARIKRAYVCARPYRPSGFRVASERRGEKVLVHNYGHGGGGFTLSWGTAELATEMVREAVGQPGPVAVIGCGVVGLTTALVLIEAGFSVTIYSRDVPPGTTSNLAGANFYPSSTVDTSLLTPRFAQRLERACRISHARFTDLMRDRRYHVSWKPQYFVTNEWNREIAAGDAVYQMIQDLYPNQVLLSAGEHPFKTRYAYREDNIFIEPTPYLSELMADLQGRGGGIEVRDFRGPEEILALEEECVVNCSGLGALALVTDEELTANPSQTVILEPQSGVDYAVTSADGSYMFPRSDGIMLGRGEGMIGTREVLAEQESLLPRGE